MNQDELKGKAKDALGRTERQVGEWTDDEKLQREGLQKQAEGKIQKGVGKIKDAARDVREKVDEHDEHKKERKDDNAA